MGCTSSSKHLYGCTITKKVEEHWSSAPNDNLVGFAV